MNVKFCLISVINSNLMNGFCILPYYIFVIGKGRPNNIQWRIVRPLGQKKGKYNLCHVLAYETCGVWEPWDSPHGWVKQQKGVYKGEWNTERQKYGVPRVTQALSGDILSIVRNTSAYLFWWMLNFV